MIKPRKVPRPFKMPWGRGQVVEEASFRGQYHEPTLQLLELERGGISIRFCYYRKGRFQRGPLMIPEDELILLRRALQRAPRLRNLLKKVVR